MAALSSAAGVGSKRGAETSTPFAPDEDDAIVGAVDMTADDGWGSDDGEGVTVMSESASF